MEVEPVADPISYPDRPILEEMVGLIAKTTETFYGFLKIYN